MKNVKIFKLFAVLFAAVFLYASPVAITAAAAQAGGVNIETAAGSGGRGHTDGGSQNAAFTLPYGIICDTNGKIIVFDTYNNAIRTVASGKVKNLTGTTEYLDNNGFPKGSYLDSALDKALLNRPASGVFNSKGDLFFADSANNAVRQIKGDAVITFCGKAAGFKDGARDAAQFKKPMAIAIDKNDNIYVADTLNNCIRKINPNGKATLVAGIPNKAGYRDGKAVEVLFRAPAGIAVNDDGSIIYVADTGNHMIRKIQNGEVTTIAGTIKQTDDGYPLGGFNNGAAREAMFNLPRGIILADGVLVIADSGNHMIRAVTKSGKVVTVAGNGDPGDAAGSCLGAVLNGPNGICVCKGQLYIADTGNNKIKKMAFDTNLYQ